jgi:hypothetical protein
VLTTARDRDALLLAARSSSGSCSSGAGRPCSTSGTYTIESAALALHLEGRTRCFSAAVRLGSTKSWKTQPTFRHAEAPAAVEARQVAAADKIRAHPSGSISFNSKLDERGLAEPESDDEDELALVDHEGDILQRDDVGFVHLADLLEDDHRPRTRRRRAYYGGLGQWLGGFYLQVCQRPVPVSQLGGPGTRAGQLAVIPIVADPSAA